MGGMPLGGDEGTSSVTFSVATGDAVNVAVEGGKVRTFEGMIEGLSLEDTDGDRLGRLVNVGDELGGTQSGSLLGEEVTVGRVVMVGEELSEGGDDNVTEGTAEGFEVKVDEGIAEGREVGEFVVGAKVGESVGSTSATLIAEMAEPPRA